MKGSVHFFIGLIVAIMAFGVWQQVNVSKGSSATGVASTSVSSVDTNSSSVTGVDRMIGKWQRKSYTRYNAQRIFCYNLYLVEIQANGGNYLVTLEIKKTRPDGSVMSDDKNTSSYEVRNGQLVSPGFGGEIKFYMDASSPDRLMGEHILIEQEKIFYFDRV